MRIMIVFTFCLIFLYVNLDLNEMFVKMASLLPQIIQSANQH